MKSISGLETVQHQQLTTIWNEIGCVANELLQKEWLYY